MIAAGYKNYIAFTDPLAFALCKKFSSDGKGVTYADAAAVTNSQFAGTFASTIASKYHHITSFDEFQYFTRLTGNINATELASQYDLRSLVIPKNITSLPAQFCRFPNTSQAAQCTTDFTVKILRTSGVISAGTYTFHNRNKTNHNFTILVPSSLVESYKAANIWKNFADNIFGY